MDVSLDGSTEGFAVRIEILECRPASNRNHCPTSIGICRPIKRSVRDDEIICLICGKSQKLLKRHLATRHELEPNAYRTMFDLKDDFPLGAPAYAAA